MAMLKLVITRQWTLENFKPLITLIPFNCINEWMNDEVSVEYSTLNPFYWSKTEAKTGCFTFIFFIKKIPSVRFFSSYTPTEYKKRNKKRIVKYDVLIHCQFSINFTLSVFFIMEVDCLVLIKTIN